MKLLAFALSLIVRVDANHVRVGQTLTNIPTGQYGYGQATYGAQSGEW